MSRALQVQSVAGVGRVVAADDEPAADVETVEVLKDGLDVVLPETAPGGANCRAGRSGHRQPALVRYLGEVYGAILEDAFESVGCAVEVAASCSLEL